MIAYKGAIREGDVQCINRESVNLQSKMKGIHLFYESNQFSDKENAAKAKQLVDLYNLFVEYYNVFASYPAGESRMSNPAQEYAKKAEDIYNSLAILINRYLTDSQAETK